MLLILYLLLLAHQICDYGLTVAADGGPQTCDDCMEYTLCPAAVKAANAQTPEDAELFRKAYCGLSETSIPKIRCCVFPTKVENIIQTTKTPTLSSRVSTSNLLAQECGPINGNRIHGGSRASLYEFPWMALISYKTREGYKFKCAGSIINSRYILTAAHCVKEKDIAGVRVGEYDISTRTDCQDQGGKIVCESHLQDLGVAEKIVHENYTSSILLGVTNDIALLRVRKDIDFNHKNVESICLPHTDELKSSNISGGMATVTGWGVTETNHDSNVLLSVAIPILTDEECRNKYDRNPNGEGGKPRKSLINNEFCAGSEGKDSCNGDSGGPLILEGDYDGAVRFIQYGVVSRGPKQCGSTTPGVYTDVRKHMDWIISNMKP